MGFSLFLPVLRIRRRLRPTEQRDTLDVEALPFQRQNLPANEGMADFRVLVDEIGDFQDQVQRRRCTATELLMSCMDTGSLI